MLLSHLSRQTARRWQRSASAAILALSSVLALGQTALPQAAAEAAPTGPVRLRQPTQPGSVDLEREVGNRQRDRVSATETMREERPGPLRPGDFELFVRRLAGQTPGDPDGVRRLGAELVTDWRGDDTTDGLPQVPADHLVAAGDELVVTIWGSVDADLRLVVDRSGRIAIPRVGSIMVAGTRFGDLGAQITQRVAQVFKNFQLSVSLGKMRQIRVYVTGFAARPGSYSVGGLSTIINAVMRAGGPSAAGSFREIQLRRGGKVITSYDLYDLLVKGDNGADRTLQSEDVVHIGPVGPQVGVIGSVNRPAVVEIRAGETVDDVLRMAGGLTAVADRTRLAVEKLDARNDVRIAQLTLPAGGSARPASGDVIRAFSAVEAAQPMERQNKRVRIEGEVAKPGEYILPAGSSVADALSMAGGLTPAAFVYGTEFNRETVRTTQQENYDRALRDLESEFARSSSTQRTTNADEAAAQSARTAATSRLVERLRAIRPSGRVVLQIDPASPVLPNLALEDGDRIYIPSRPTTVGVFGSVFNAGSYLYGNDRRIDDYLRLAGGPTRGADVDSVFVVRANGSVVSGRQRASGWGSRSEGLDGLGAQPGDTIFVPEEMNKTTVVQHLKDWTQILSQFGLGVAAIKAIGN